MVAQRINAKLQLDGSGGRYIMLLSTLLFQTLNDVALTDGGIMPAIFTRVNIDDVRNVIIWGNHSATQVCGYWALFFYICPFCALFAAGSAWDFEILV
jgi:hypothetical protein